MANEFVPNQAATFAGLGTYTCTLLAAGPYTIEVKSTIPLASGLQIELKQNSTSLVTVGGSSTNPSASQGSIGAGAVIQAAANDTVSVILTSSNAVDSVPNNVKTSVNVFLGPQ